MLVRALPSYRKTMFDMYQMLEHPRTAAEQADLLREFELLAHEINSLWVPKGCKEAYGNVLRMLAQLARWRREVAPAFPARVGGLSPRAADSFAARPRCA